MLDKDGIEAAADCLDDVGRHYHWWRRPAQVQSWRALDPISQAEFLGIVESVISAYERARVPPAQP